MNVSLTPQLEQLVRDKVASGFYNNASEVIREALRLMEVRDHATQLQREVALGFAQLDRGEGHPLDMAALKQAARTQANTGRKVKAVVRPSA